MKFLSRLHLEIENLTNNLESKVMKNKQYTIDVTQLEAIDELDNEELDLYNEIKAGNYTLRADKETINEYAQIFKDAEKRSRAISIRLQERDYIGIKAKALELGMPYQSLINSIIHQFLENKKLA